MFPMTNEERAQLRSLNSKLEKHAPANQTVGSYYKGTYRTRMLGLGLPPVAQQMIPRVGWAATVVDTLEERLELLGWADSSGNDDDELRDVYRDSGVLSESSAAHIDALVHGIGFLTVTAGGRGESKVLIRAHSATSTTADIDHRTGLVRSAVTHHSATSATLWGPELIVELARETENGTWGVVARIEHGMGATPVVALVNKTRAGDRRGRSEITPAVVSSIDSATRTLLAMDVNREFLSVPSRYALGMDVDQFEGADGQAADAWKLVSTRMLVAPRDEDGELPSFGEFSSVSAGPYLEQVRGLAEVLAAEAGIPASYLGIEASTPSSADAIRQREARLIRKAERRISQFGRGWAVVGRMVRAILADASFYDVDAPTPRWADPATPTVAATADAMTKLVGAGVVPVCDVVWERLGFSDTEIQRMEAVLTRQNAANRLSALAGLASGASSQAVAAAAGEEGTPSVTEDPDAALTEGE